MGFRKIVKTTITQLGEDLLRDRRILIFEKDKEVLHRFRLNMKKLRVFYRWISRMSKRPIHAKTWTGWRTLYKKSNLIRDMQVFPDTTTTAFVDVITLEKQLKKACKDFDRSLRKQPSRTLKKIIAGLLNRISNMPGKSIKESYQQYLEEHIQLIAHKKTLLPDERQLHRIRRELKELVFLLEPRIIADPENDSLLLITRLLKDKQEILGTWHDQVNKLFFLKERNAPEEVIDKQGKVIKQSEKVALSSLDDFEEIIIEAEFLRF